MISPGSQVIVRNRSTHQSRQARDGDHGAAMLPDGQYDHGSVGQQRQGQAGAVSRTVGTARPAN